MKRKPWKIGAVLAAGLLLTAAAPPTVQGLLDEYRAAGATAPEAARGQALWTRDFPDPAGGTRRCASCHDADPRRPGKHVRTGEGIGPMTPGAEGRLTDRAKVERWFTRNCKWTFGRECTPQEKADFLTFFVEGARRRRAGG
jgi:hypothetical protein